MRAAFRTTLTALPLLTVLAAPLPAVAQEMTAEDIKELALQAIIENPEIVMQAVAILQEREAAAAEAQAEAAIADSRDTLERDPNAPVGGNPDGTVTVVEFFDYNCGFCRRAGPEIDALLAADTDVRVVYREWPILSEGSVFAARAALAAREQGKYDAMHKALMTASSRLDERSVMQIAAGLDLDADKLRADMESAAVNEHLQTTRALAESLGFTGTPSFVIGDTRVPGFVESDQLQQIVNEARDEG